MMRNKTDTDVAEIVAGLAYWSGFADAAAQYRYKYHNDIKDLGTDTLREALWIDRGSAAQHIVRWILRNVPRYRDIADARERYSTFRRDALNEITASGAYMYPGPYSATTRAWLLSVEATPDAIPGRFVRRRFGRDKRSDAERERDKRYLTAC